MLFSFISSQLFSIQNLLVFMSLSLIILFIGLCLRKRFVTKIAILTINVLSVIALLSFLIQVYRFGFAQIWKPASPVALQDCFILFIMLLIFFLLISRSRFRRIS